MKELPKHLSVEELSDLVDDVLDADSSKKIRAHLAGCSVCASEHDRLRSLLDASNKLPRSVMPPNDLWPELRASLESRKSVVLPTATSGPAGGSSGHGPWRSTPMLAAAAVVLVVLSSGITALVLRSPAGADERPTASAPPSILPRNRSEVMLQAGFRKTEVEYRRTIDELQVAVNAKRDRLSPETVRTVEHSIAVIDSAIAEARAALLSDPNSQVLVDLLSASYQRKLDLLRRTSELGSKT